jgi:hypothetical protein
MRILPDFSILADRGSIGHFLIFDKKEQGIAVKAIEGASGAKALSHINQIAMEQAKNRPQG